MCDYSVEAKQQREAKVGDELITSTFGGAHVGFADLNYPNTAVCLRPGTELSFDKNIVENHAGLFSGRAVEHNIKVARFGRVNLEDPLTLHDALEFPNGEGAYVGFLKKGQRATVIQMPVSANVGTTAQNEDLSIPEPIQAEIESAGVMRRAFERIFG